MAVPPASSIRPATAFQQALAAMRNEAFLKTPKYQEQQQRARRTGAHPKIIEFERKLVKRLAQMGIPVFCPFMVRTYDEQLKLFHAGVSRDSPEDGLWPHMAFAVDIIHGKLGYLDGENEIPNAWPAIGHVGKEVAASMQIKITWGGDWKGFYDPCHFELTDWRKIAREGDRYWSPNRQASA